MNKAYERITERIIALLEEGTVPWRKPWRGQEDWPKNLVSGKEYRGVNVFMLGATMYTSPWWLTFKQAKDRGGNVKKGEKGFPCIYWNWTEKKDNDSGDIRMIPFAKYYTVFNAVQCEGIACPEQDSLRPSASPIETCEDILAGMPLPPRVDTGRSRAAYHPVQDCVYMPESRAFESDEDYYATLFHELVHSTGHSSRLGRPGITDPIVFGSHTYAKEELIAEMGASFLCGRAGIENKVIENSAAYIDNWMRRIRKDQTLVIKAASQAQKAADYVLRRDPYSENATANTDT